MAFAEQPDRSAFIETAYVFSEDAALPVGALEELSRASERFFSARSIVLVITNHDTRSEKRGRDHDTRPRPLTRAHALANHLTSLSLPRTCARSSPAPRSRRSPGCTGATPAPGCATRTRPRPRYALAEAQASLAKKEAPGSPRGPLDRAPSPAPSPSASSSPWLCETIVDLGDIGPVVARRRVVPRRPRAPRADLPARVRPAAPHRGLKNQKTKKKKKPSRRPEGASPPEYDHTATNDNASREETRVYHHRRTRTRHVIRTRHDTTRHDTRRDETTL